MVMEYAGDMSLDEYIKTLNVKNRDRIIYDIAIQLLKAHRFLHQNKIIYNNMKSSDIIVKRDADGNPRIKLIDFDMSVMFEEGKPLVGRVINQDLPNSPPEYAKYGWPSMPKADTWFIGARLYQLITGKSVTEDTVDMYAEEYATSNRNSLFRVLTNFVKDFSNGLLTPPPATKYGNDGGDVAPYLTDLLKVLLAPKVADRPTPEEYLNRPADMRHPAQMQLVVRPRN
ncbi:kinase-like domain-containing protein [Syncephalis plumigaleata]|nr:kinase-like domain-containing protein [Syncephalis plumigaleata]